MTRNLKTYLFENGTVVDGKREFTSLRQLDPRLENALICIPCKKKGQCIKPGLP